MIVPLKFWLLLFAVMKFSEEETEVEILKQNRQYVRK